MEDIKSMSSTQVEALARMAQFDLYFLTYGILNYTKLTPEEHGGLCKFVETEEALRRMIFMPRSTFKSTIATVADGVRQGLLYPDTLRMAIISEIRDNAVGWLGDIKTHFATNEVLRFLFPTLLPERTEGPGSWWKDDEACLRRASGHVFKEATYTALGLTSAATSQHYTHLKIDDFIGEEAKHSEAVMKRAVDAMRVIEPILDEPTQNVIDWIGTRKGLTDGYTFIMKRWAGDLAIYNKPPINSRGEPNFPHRLPLRFLVRMRAEDPVTYFSEYANDPIADGTKDFDFSKIKAFDFDAKRRVVWRDEETGALRRWDLDQLDIVMTCDPNGGSKRAPDKAAIVVSGVSPKDQVFVLELSAERDNPDEFVDRIYETWKRWEAHVRVLGIEQAGQQQTLFYFKKKQRETGVWIRVEPLKPKNRDKESRIRRAVGPIINQGRLYMLNGQHEGLRKQLQFYPQVANDDEVDALSYGPEVWRSPLSSDSQEEADDARRTVLAHAKRHGRTGYSA